MEAIWQRLSHFFIMPKFIDIIDILIVSYAIYKLLMLTRETRARSVLMGLGMLVIASLITSSLHMYASYWILTQILFSGALVMVVLFQPEIRRTLEQIGRGAFIPDTLTTRDMSWVSDHLIEATLRLSHRKVGALIVIEGRTRLGEIISSGTKLEALISSGLLENIFEPNTPLHDGAVVVRGDRIMAAGCLLNISDDDQISRDLGTRHRAALGISEITDSLTIVVSEETGIITLAEGGKLRRHLDEKSLRDVLSKIYIPQAQKFTAKMRRRMHND